MITPDQNAQNLDLFLEIFNGCQYSCSGCLIDKTGQQDLDLTDISSISAFVDDLMKSGISPINCHLGPTDFMTASTSKQCLVPEVAELTKKFKCVVFNGTFLRSDIIDEYADLVNKVFAGQTYKLAIPVELKHLLNPSYRNTIMENRKRFVDRCDKMTYRKSYWNSNIIDYKNTMMDPINKMGFVKLTNEFEEFTEQHLDLVISAARLDLGQEFNRQTLVNQLQYYNSLFEKYIVDQESMTTINFTYANEHEGFNNDLVYRNGKIYHPPFIGDPLATFHDKFSLGTREMWSSDRYLEFRQELFTDGLIYSQEAECGDCEYLSQCANRRFLNMMEILDHKECLAPKRVFQLRAAQPWN